MPTLRRILLSLPLILVAFLVMQSQQQPITPELEVKLRMLGHELLIAHGDSTSRVLPVQRFHNEYILGFEQDFRFEPNRLVDLTERVLQETDLASTYVLAMKDCETQETIYSFKADHTAKEDIVPCGGRFQPLQCYQLVLTILDDDAQAATDMASTETPSYWYFSMSGLLAFLVMLTIYGWYKRHMQPTPTHLIALGNYTFDARKGLLQLADTTETLTSKEAELLKLLYEHANKTVTREDILHQIWQDEGHYVGRTLDVFISKLRKKLAEDTQLEIKTIRGVGYSLVLP